MRFSSRCPIFKLLPEDKQKRCLEEKPEVITLDGDDHGYACYYPDGADLPDVALEFGFVEPHVCCGGDSSMRIIPASLKRMKL